MTARGGPTIDRNPHRNDSELSFENLALDQVRVETPCTTQASAFYIYANSGESGSPDNVGLYSTNKMRSRSSSVFQRNLSKERPPYKGKSYTWEDFGTTLEVGN
ncbi:unnamed protein product [Protopolystoma xenopodis]|uniref:Uncharacterized protein n=1 Tax=Protopolystoma xenopodis TaxID=117903 RepID=A0A448XFX2_9PLAT|nr:unnamed protein product [Protopolystoma xenopodis]